VARPVPLFVAFLDAGASADVAANRAALRLLRAIAPQFSHRAAFVHADASGAPALGSRGSDREKGMRSITGDRPVFIFFCKDHAYFSPRKPNNKFQIQYCISDSDTFIFSFQKISCENSRLIYLSFMYFL
jgi:hypothetical protein